jgi:PIN domain nuclease of toxin-antitoxin system
VRVLLDTHAALWLAEGAQMRRESIDAIESAADDASVFLSPVSAWEIGVLVAKGRFRLRQPPEIWLEAFLATPGIGIIPLDPLAAVRSYSIAGLASSDPADRLLVATAQMFDLTFVTRDRKILAYAKSGPLRAIEC